MRVTINGRPVCEIGDMAIRELYTPEAIPLPKKGNVGIYPVEDMKGRNTWGVVVLSDIPDGFYTQLVKGLDGRSIIGVDSEKFFNCERGDLTLIPAHDTLAIKFYGYEGTG